MAEETAKDPGVALLWSWLVPGAGHWYGGRRWRAAVHGGIVIALFVGGVVMGGLACVSVAGHKWAFLLQIFDGPMTLATAIVSWWTKADIPPSRMTDLGLTFTLVSAALNVLVMADAYFLADRSDEPEKAEEASA